MHVSMCFGTFLRVLGCFGVAQGAKKDLAVFSASCRGAIVIGPGQFCNVAGHFVTKGSNFVMQRPGGL